MFKQTVILCLLITSLLLSPAAANDTSLRTSQASLAMQHYASAQARWQSELAQLIVRKKPEFTSQAMAQRNLQLNRISLRNARFRYLLKKDPKRLSMDKDITALSNFDWADKDSKTLAVLNPNYEKLETHTEQLEAANNKLPRWDEFRAYFKKELSKTDEYKKLQGELTTAQKSADEILAKGRKK